MPSSISAICHPRFRSALWVIIAVLPFCLFPSRATTSPSRHKAAAEDRQQSADEWQSQGRIREGTEIKEVEGTFRMTGDRVTFFSDDSGRRYVALENLNLERIVARITDDPTPRQWLVSGLVTEFRGANYLLIRRAMLKARLQPTDDDFFSPGG